MKSELLNHSDEVLRRFIKTGTDAELRTLIASLRDVRDADSESPEAMEQTTRASRIIVEAWAELEAREDAKFQAA